MDTNGDGKVDYEEFLMGVRGKMNQKRQNISDKAFLKFDKDGSGEITISEIKAGFNTKMHPKV